MTSALLMLVGAALLVAGPAMVVRGVAGRQMIQRELSAQRIVFPDEAGLPAELARHRGNQVRTGEQAKRFADLIAANVARVTEGRSYAEINQQVRTCGGTDLRLAGLRETAFMGQSLRSSLLGAYQAWQITTLVIGLGGLLAAIGLAFLAQAMD